MFYKAFTNNQNHVYSLAKCYYACQNHFRVTHGSAHLHSKAASDLIGWPIHWPFDGSREFTDKNLKSVTMASLPAKFYVSITYFMLLRHVV